MRGDELCDRLVHQHRHRLSGALADPVQLPDPATVDPGLVEAFIVVAADTFGRHW